MNLTSALKPGLSAVTEIVVGTRDTAPHVGSGTQETRGAMADLVVANLLAHRDGKPLLTRVP